MGVRAADAIHFLLRLLIFLLLLCFLPAVPTAERPLPFDGAEASSHLRAPPEVLSTQAMEAIFAGGGSWGLQRLNLMAQTLPEKIILWDEGPASKAMPVAQLP